MPLAVASPKRAARRQQRPAGGVQVPKARCSTLPFDHPTLGDQTLRQAAKRIAHKSGTTRCGTGIAHAAQHVQRHGIAWRSPGGVISSCCVIDLDRKPSHAALSLLINPGDRLVERPR